MTTTTRTAPYTGSFPVVEDAGGGPHPVAISGHVNPSGDATLDSADNPHPVALRTLLAGELALFNRLAGGAIAQRGAEVSADGIIHTGPCILYGFKVLVAGTSITVYDNTAASGTRVNAAEPTTTVGAFIRPAGEGVGVLMQNGIYVDLTGGTYLPIFVPLV